MYIVMYEGPPLVSSRHYRLRLLCQKCNILKKRVRVFIVNDEDALKSLVDFFEKEGLVDKIEIYEVKRVSRGG